EVLRIENRLLLVTSDTRQVSDVIHTWNDHRDDGVPTGTLTGRVTDAATGEPVMDVDVSAGGVHTATDFRGEFRIAGLPAGSQRVTVHTVDGRFRADSRSVDLEPGMEAVADFSLVRAAPVR